MKRICNIISVVLLVAVFFSCKENSLEKQRKNELKKLEEFMRAHYAGHDPRPSGLFYFPLEEGTGDSIKIGDRVQIYYDLWTLDSIKKSSSGRYEPLQLIVSHPSQLSSSPNSIGGMRALNEALTYMKKGSKSMLIFDSSLGFGQYGAGGVGGFTPLMMEVEVYKIYPGQAPEEEGQTP